MRLGDLVKPSMSCSGQPGSVRCKVAIVLEDKDDVSTEIVCKCGVSCQPRWTLEPVKAAQTILAYSADPM